MTNISRFDVVDYLDDESKMAAYLSGSIEEGGVPLLLKALGDVARARGMSGIAEAAGLTRPSLYKSLGEGGNPSLKTIFQVIDALGFSLAIEPKAKATAVRSYALGVANHRTAVAEKSAVRRYAAAAKSAGKTSSRTKTAKKK